MVESFELYEGGLGVNSPGWLPLLCTLVVPYQILTESFYIPTKSGAINSADGVTLSSCIFARNCVGSLSRFFFEKNGGKNHLHYKLAFLNLPCRR